MLYTLLLWAIVSIAVAAPPLRTSEGQVIRELETELRKESSKGDFSGAVLIAKAGAPIFQAANNYADREKKIRNTVNTKFRFGSMGKMFTAVAVLQLVQAGKIRLDASIAQYLPGYPNKDVAAVTIHQLLTHTGGTGDIFSPEFDEHRNEIRTLSDYVKLYGNRALQFTPGGKWSYSNYGYLLLGRIVEVVSGQSYYDYVRDHIFNPAGMNSTGNLPEDQHVPDLAIGYTRGGGTRLIGPGPGPRSGALPPLGPPPTLGPRLTGSSPPPSTAPLKSTNGTLPYRGTSAGGGYSTVGDLLNFVNALISNRLLDAHYTELLTTGKVETTRRGVKYAYGFEDQLAPDGARFFGHGGGSPGTNGRLSVFPQSGYVVIVLANLDPPPADISRGS